MYPNSVEPPLVDLKVTREPATCRRSSLPLPPLHGQVKADVPPVTVIPAAVAAAPTAVASSASAVPRETEAAMDETPAGAFFFSCQEEAKERGLFCSPVE